MRTILVGLALIVMGCGGPMLPVTTGAQGHFPPDAVPGKPYTVVVWSNNAVAGNAVAAYHLQQGFPVVERSQLQTILDEQRIHLAHTADADADVLKAGRLAGADMVIFVEARMTPTTDLRGGFVSDYGGGLSSQTTYHVSVSVRGVAITNGQVVWSGSATYPKPVNNLEQSIGFLADAAVRRATCIYVLDEKGCHKS